MGKVLSEECKTGISELGVQQARSGISRFWDIPLPSRISRWRDIPLRSESGYLAGEISEISRSGAGYPGSERDIPIYLAREISRSGAGYLAESGISRSTPRYLPFRDIPLLGGISPDRDIPLYVRISRKVRSPDGSCGRKSFTQISFSGSARISSSVGRAVA